MAGGKASAMLEYRLVPVIMCSVKIGEELNAAALTRGLGGPVKKDKHLRDRLSCAGCFFSCCYVWWLFAIPIVTMITGR